MGIQPSNSRLVSNAATEVPAAQSPSQGHPLLLTLHEGSTARSLALAFWQYLGGFVAVGFCLFVCPPFAIRLVPAPSLLSCAQGTGARQT